MKANLLKVTQHQNHIHSHMLSKIQKVVPPVLEKKLKMRAEKLLVRNNPLFNYFKTIGIKFSA
jgi:hypothetical protein